MEKGKLLYDESNQKEMKKHKLFSFFRWGGWQFISCSLLVLLIIFIYTISKVVLLLLFFLPLVIIVGFFYFLGATGHVGNLKVYENGIQYPRRGIREILSKRDFASFRDIDKIKIDERGIYIIHLYLENEIVYRAIYKEDIFDEKKFKKSIRKKAVIESV
jgi:hypothetical protein